MKNLPQNKFKILLTIFSCLFLVSVTISPVFSADYQSYPQLISGYLNLQNQYPTYVSHTIIGQTVLGNDILMFSVGNPNANKILIDASIHGNEHATSEALYYTIQQLLQQNNPTYTTILDNVCYLIIPAINVDRYATSRYNANGVDLNRNYQTGWYHTSTSGPYPLSEPETQAVHNIFLTQQPKWYLNLHTGAYRVTPPWAYTYGSP